MVTTLFGPDGPVRFWGDVQGEGTAPSEEDLVIQMLSPSQWRVSDGRFPEHDAFSLLGFIEEKGDTFELTQLEHGFQWFHYFSLAEAIAHFTHTVLERNLAEPELS